MRKIKGLRWYMIALVTLGTVLGYLTRNTVAAAAPTLMEELHISTQQYSYIIAAYSAAYTIMQPVAGYVLDILGTKIGYVDSICQCNTPFNYLFRCFELQCLSRSVV